MPRPGNLRQLLSMLKVSPPLADDGDMISPGDLAKPHDGRAPLSARPVERDERVAGAIRAANGNMSLAAKRPGISRSTPCRRREKADCRIS